MIKLNVITYQCRVGHWHVPNTPSKSILKSLIGYYHEEKILYNRDLWSTDPVRNGTATLKSILKSLIGYYHEEKILYNRDIWSTDTNKDAEHHTDTSTPIIIFKNGKIECNHVCQCHVGVSIVSTSGPFVNHCQCGRMCQCSCQIQYRDIISYNFNFGILHL